VGTILQVGATAASTAKISPLVEPVPGPNIFCERGPYGTALEDYPRITGKVCDTPTASADTNAFIGLYSGTVYFGPLMENGEINEGNITSYRIYWTNSVDQKLGAALASVTKQGIVAVCCQPGTYNVSLMSVQIPDTAVRFTVLPVDSNGWEVPLGESTATVSDWSLPTTTTMTQTDTTVTTVTGTSVTVTTPAPTPAPVPVQVADVTIAGTMEMTVNNPTAFIQDPQVEIGIKNGIAEIAGVSANYINVTLSVARRLEEVLGGGLRRQLQSAGSVIVNYIITVPPSAGIADPGTTVTNALASQSTSAVTSIIQQKVNTATGSSTAYTVDVTSIPTPTVVSGTPAPTPAPNAPPAAGTTSGARAGGAPEAAFLAVALAALLRRP